MMLTLGCSAKKQFPTTTIDVAGHPVLVELAVNDKDRARGLMHRPSMPKDDGMLFIYPDSAPRSFWMKDTKLPLSIAFIDASGEIVKIADMQPLTTSSTKSIYPAKYALEMNQGWFEQNGVEKGERVVGIPADAEVGVE
ncbi:MAG: DUF192 domain-containing protein [Alphaproteobacteria bacterium]|nr:DUF192 domain-containing protein [Alphaproteobacteria bacterium]